MGLDTGIANYTRGKSNGIPSHPHPPKYHSSPVQSSRGAKIGMTSFVTMQMSLDARCCYVRSLARSRHCAFTLVQLWQQRVPWFALKACHILLQVFSEFFTLGKFVEIVVFHLQKFHRFFDLNSSSSCHFSSFCH